MDVWEVAFVWAWEVEAVEQISQLEAQLFHFYNERNPLMNGSVPHKPEGPPLTAPEPKRVQVMANDEIQIRLDPAYRLPRQVQQVAQLVDYILNVHDKKHLRRSLRVHFERLSRFYDSFLKAGSEGVEGSDDATE